MKVVGTMMIIELERFRLQHLLGSGANYEVYAGIDNETGREVVLKRPWGQTLRGGQYRSIDALSARVIDIHQRLGETMPYVAPLIGYTERTRHDRYFGDAFPQEYHVLVEERAQGIPLIGDIKDRFRGIPIGLAHNLFALYPLVAHRIEGTTGIVERLLDVEEAFIRAGCLVLDLRPQNVFFDPKLGQITVIDIGAFVDGSARETRHQATDLHDCLAELCKFYLAPHTPPSQVTGYRQLFGMGPALGFRQELERMIQSFRQHTRGALQEAALDTLQKIKARAYTTIDAFRHDLQVYGALCDERNRNLQDFPTWVDAWRQGMELLKEEYWRRFLFDAEVDLVHYQ